MKEELEFPTEWLNLKKEHFRILAAVTVLADNNRTFRGKLSELCQSLSIKPSSVNIKNIKAALAFLTENDYTNIIIDKDTYTISLSKATDKNKTAIKIKKSWYNLIREAESKAGWVNVLKVFLVLLEISQINQYTITYKQIGEIIGCSASTAERAVKTICSIDFKDFKFRKDIIKERYEIGENRYAYKTIGTEYTLGIDFE